MPTPILATKLYIPQTRSKLIARPRLLEQLNRGCHGKLTLISAPAGFGKTTLVSSWISHLRFTSDDLRLDAAKENQIVNQKSKIVNRIAWLSLDQNDNDPLRFLTYFITALQQIEPQIGQTAQGMFQSPQPPSPEAAMTALINDIAAAATEFILVLDDYHLITAPPIHQAITFLLDNMPPLMHLVVAGRVDPPLPLSRLRARDQLTEIRADDLRFTPPEAAQFLRETMGLSLSADDITTLDSRIEGWAVGLQMAALALAKQADTSRFITQFTGSHRYIIDYLTDEVFQQQPPHIQHFLLRTAILDRFCAPLCDAVLVEETETRESDNKNSLPLSSQKILTELDTANIFLIPLDDNRRWYRYHHLFADFLRDHLQQQTSPAERSTLHERASRWYELQLLMEEAIDHAMQAGDTDRAALLIATTAGETLWERGQALTLQRQVDALPQETLQRHPKLYTLLAWSSLITGNFAQAEKDAQTALDLIQKPHFAAIPAANAKLVSEITGTVAAIQAIIARICDNPGHALELSRQALAQIPFEYHSMRATLTYNLGVTQGQLGDLTTAKQTMAAVVKDTAKLKNDFLNHLTRYELGKIEHIRGNLHRAAEIYQETIASPLQPTPALGLSHLGIGLIYYEWDELDKAEQSLKTAVSLGEQAQIFYLLLPGYYLLARVLMLQGDMAGMQQPCIGSGN